MGAQKGHPRAPIHKGRSNTDTRDAGATPRGTRASAADKEEGRSKEGEATRTGNQNGGDGRACAWEAATTKGMALLASPVATGCQGNPCSTGIMWGVFPLAQMGCSWGPTRGRPAVRGKATYGGQSGQRVEEEHGTWASRTRKHGQAGYGRPWTEARGQQTQPPRRQPTQPQYSNHRAPLTRKRHTMPHPAQPRHTNHWAPRTRKRHQQEHRPQRPTKRSNPTQHAKGRTGGYPGPRKETTTRWDVTQGGGGRLVWGRCWGGGGGGILQGVHQCTLG